MSDPVTPSFDRLGYLEHTVAALTARVAQLEHALALSPRPPPMPHAEPAAAPSLETKLGTFWLSRIGIVSLITGTALFILTYFGELGAPVRVGLGYAIAAALAWGGLRLARRHATLGRIVFGGGLAIGYFVTYALYFVPAMQVVDSESLGIALVALAIAAIVGIAHRMRSETVAGVALFLGLHTGLLSEVTALSLVCSTLLAVGAAFFLVANRWVIVPFSTVIAVYTTHATLAFGLGGPPVDAPIALTFLCVDFAVFATAALLRPDLPARHHGTLAALDWAALVVLGGHALLPASDGAVFAGLVVVAAVHTGLAGVARQRRAPGVVVALYVGLGLASLALALPLRLDGAGLVVGWLGVALAGAVVARLAARTEFAGLALALVAIAYGYADVEAAGIALRLGCVAAVIAIDRLHAPQAGAASLRGILAVAAGAGLAHVGLDAVEPMLVAALWVAIAGAMFALGFALRAREYRWSGFLLLGLAALRFVGVQVRTLSAAQQIATFVVTGVVLLVVSYAYARTRER